MKLNLNASELAESLKLKSNADSENTNLSSLIDQLDNRMGQFLALAENDPVWADLDEVRNDVVSLMNRICREVHTGSEW